MTSDLVGFKCVFNASVTDESFNLTSSGYSVSQVLNPGLKLAWMDGETRTFKPDTNLTIHVSTVNVQKIRPFSNECCFQGLNSQNACQNR